MEKIESISSELVERVDKEADVETKREILRVFIRDVENDPTAIIISKSTEFFGDSIWINCNRPLSSTDFTGRLVLADFFTYCCINCIHIMPFLHDLESIYKVSDGFLVVGVHSAKFPNEKLNENIRNAISRYNIKHPVVNDNEIKIWEEFSVICWPTLILISPTGKVVFSIPGESHTEFIKLFIEESLKYYTSSNLLRKTELAVTVSLDGNNSISSDVIFDKSKLRFPGKVAVDDTGKRVAISDTGNNRVIIVSVGGKIIKSIGGNDSGFLDGTFETAKFNSPQGVTWHGSNTIFVADCDNHAIRKIDLLVKRVVTVAGTGTQGNDLEGGNTGLDQVISSPWDVAVGGSPSCPGAKSILYIAMSGCHQIWALFLKTTDYQKGVEMELGTCIRFAGSGKEENRNNSYPHKAGFAQPSGLAVDEDDHVLYVADSESSTIRKVSLSNGAVQALVGGEIDPMNLFSFGDKDGKGREAKLQHPIGIAWDQKRKLLYVADTYNHKIKVIDPKKKICYALLKDAGEKSVFDEPSGLSLDPACDYLYVADTNNHDIKIISLEDSKIRSMNLKCEDTSHLPITETDGPAINKIAKPLTSKSTVAKILEQFVIYKEGTVDISLKCPNFHLNADAPSAWQISCRSFDDVLIFIRGGKFESTGEADITLTTSRLLDHQSSGDSQNRTIEVCIECVLYHCLKNSDVCMMHNYKAIVPFCINFNCGSSDTNAVLELEIL